RVPPVLHRQAESAGYRWSYRSLQAAFRCVRRQVSGCRDGSPMRFSEHLKKASLVGAFFVFALFSLQAQALCPATGPLSRVEVAAVTDGDTLRLRDGRRVRLIGVNAPELGGKGRSAEPFAQASKRRLQALIDASDGRIGLLPGQQARDQYGRVLAHAFDLQGTNLVQGTNLEAALLAEGLGYFVAIAPNTALAACHRRAEQQAREASRGLWRRSPTTAAENLRRAGFAVVRSEEHTSELQSREKLVCRLLLEKK